MFCLRNALALLAEPLKALKNCFYIESASLVRAFLVAVNAVSGNIICVTLF